MNSSKTSNANEKAKNDTKKRIVKEGVITRTRNEGNPALDALIRDERLNKDDSTMIKPTYEYLHDKFIRPLIEEGYCVFFEYRKYDQGNEHCHAISLESEVDRNKVVNVLTRDNRESNSSSK
jgi:hypothetical protein